MCTRVYLVDAGRHLERAGVKKTGDPASSSSYSLPLPAKWITLTFSSYHGWVNEAFLLSPIYRGLESKSDPFTNLLSWEWAHPLPEKNHSHFLIISIPLSAKSVLKQIDWRRHVKRRPASPLFSPADSRVIIVNRKWWNFDWETMEFSHNH